jgi:hypothetical protein
MCQASPEGHSCQPAVGHTCALPADTNSGFAELEEVVALTQQAPVAKKHAHILAVQLGLCRPVRVLAESC